MSHGTFGSALLMLSAAVCLLHAASLSALCQNCVSIVSAVCLLHAASVFALSQFCGLSAVEFGVCIGSKLLVHQSVCLEKHR